MVHALELAWELLHQDGTLIDMHPRGEPSPINALIQGEQRKLGEIHETDNFVEYHQADEALRNAVERGYFRQARHSRYEFKIYTSTLDELRHYLSEYWSDALIDPDIETKAAHLLHSSGINPDGLRFEVIEQILIYRLEKVG